MQAIADQVLAARRRLMWGQFLTAAGICLSVGFVIALFALAAVKIWPLEVDADFWRWGWLGGAGCLGLMFAAAWTLLRQPSELEVAAEIDRRCRLRERVASAVALGPDEVETPFGQALVRDAEERLRRSDVGEQFAVQPPLWSGTPLLLLCGALLLTWLVQDAVAEPADPATENEAEVAAKIKRESKKLQKKLRERSEQIRKKEHLQDAADLFKRLESELAREFKEPEPNPKKALAKLNDLADEVRKQRQQLGDPEQIREQLKQLEDLKQGPAEKLTQSLKDGSLKKAAEELERLQQRLRNGEMNAQQQQELAEQLRRMSEQLQQAAQAHRDAQEQLRQEIAGQEAAGNQQAAQEAREQLEQLQRQGEQMDQLEQLARNFGQAGQQAESGQLQNAAQQLAEAQEQLEQLQRQDQQLEQFDGALSDIAECKNCLRGQPGQKAGAGLANQPGQGGQNQGAGNGQQLANRPGGQPGNSGANGGPSQNGGNRGGTEAGRGVGSHNPEEEIEGGTFDTRVKTLIRQGKAIVVGTAEGDNIAGEARETIQENFAVASEKQSDGALTDRPIPKDQREHAREYFDRFRDGE